MYPYSVGYVGYVGLLLIPFQCDGDHIQEYAYWQRFTRVLSPTSSGEIQHETRTQVPKYQIRPYCSSSLAIHRAIAGRGRGDTWRFA